MLSHNVHYGGYANVGLFWLWITVQEIRKQAEFLIGLKEHLNQSLTNPAQWEPRICQYTGALVCLETQCAKGLPGNAVGPEGVQMRSHTKTQAVRESFQKEICPSISAPVNAALRERGQFYTGRIVSQSWKQSPWPLPPFRRLNQQEVSC